MLDHQAPLAESIVAGNPHATLERRGLAPTLERGSHKGAVLGAGLP
ncbi:hypothetical protein CCP4SC76_600044 [Gammaproteobacteria bacterium]